jgi:uncharacterized membrane protein
MPHGHGSRYLQSNLSTASLRAYEDYLDWIENQSSSPALTGERLTLLLRFAAILTAAGLVFSRLPATPKR